MWMCKMTTLLCRCDELPLLASCNPRACLADQTMCHGLKKSSLTCAHFLAAFDAISVLIYSRITLASCLAAVILLICGCIARASCISLQLLSDAKRPAGFPFLLNAQRTLLCCNRLVKTLPAAKPTKADRKPSKADRKPVQRRTNRN